MMSENFQSSTANEALNGLGHNKRGNDLNDVDLVQKKPKISPLDTENADKVVENPEEVSHPALTETNAQNANKIPVEEGKGNQICNPSCSSQDKISCNSKWQLPVIEADAAEDKGSRHNMEDAWVVLPDASFEFPGKLRCAHFAIYDGHGGRLAAEYARDHLHANVLSAGLPRELMDVKAAKKAILEVLKVVCETIIKEEIHTCYLLRYEWQLIDIQSGFRRTDENLIQQSSSGGWQDGATAVCVWILGQTVLVANIGDAKAVLARSSIADGFVTSCPLKAIVMTREHKAIYPQERARIQKAGGSIGSNGRLQGRLEVSRAFGDRQFKKVGVIATPDVHSFDLTEREHFIILGCDGLWGVFGPSDAVDFVDKQLKEGLSATAVSRRLVREAVRERRCKDNCTAIVIVFRRG
ncbi:protein phosphatase 2C family protein isoform X1 [Tasmannia lanceolata]|uniref:protein phosphatase 2C family protein isoform X1 n=1 Tax=Tasmannia lanceolata TaxID=3420 RepID=UPI004063776B